MHWSNRSGRQEQVQALRTATAAGLAVVLVWFTLGQIPASNLYVKLRVSSH